KSGLIHKNRGRPPSTKIDDSTRQKVIDYYVQNYPDANISHYKAIVKEDFDIDISEETLRLWFLDNNILSPKSHKKTKRAVAKKIRTQMENTNSKKEPNQLKERLEETNRISNPNLTHPRRPRSKYFGEKIQMDASSYQWIEGETWHLHLAVDDATSTVVGAYFDYQETLNGYYNVTHQIICNYGIPAMFYTDRRTVFIYRSGNKQDSFTQFQRACNKLGIEIKVTSVPQAKGRIERLNASFQSRLPIELRRANVTNIDQANSFLKIYIAKYNKEFALQLNTTKSVFTEQPDEDTLLETLSVISTRKVDKGHCITYMNSYYIPLDSEGQDVLLIPKTECSIINTFDGRLLIEVNGKSYAARKVELHEATSKEFDPPAEKSEYKPPRPAPDHPWRQYKNKKKI
ncbi:MAG: ISNCY family transposase, partial [Holdemanella sp.]|nr:ISNCY family transposase [Holdemanella sp.]